MFDREEELRFDFPRPLTYQKLSAGMDREGNVTALWHDLCSPWPLARALPIALQPGADPQTKVDWSVLTGADSWYSPANYYVRALRERPRRAGLAVGVSARQRRRLCVLGA